MGHAVPSIPAQRQYPPPELPAIATEPPKSKPRRVRSWIAGVVGVVSFGAGAGLVALVGAASPVTAPSETTRTVTVQASPATVYMTVPATPVVTPEQAPPPAPAARSIGPGTYLVGRDITPGSYRTTGPTDSLPCYWARLKDTTGDFGTIIANGLPQGQTTITIKKGDGAVEFSGSCEWTPA
jgi:hypothetical protein